MKIDIDDEKLLEDIHKKLEKFNEDIHSDNPPRIKYGETIRIDLIHNWGYIKISYRGNAEEFVNWKDPLNKFNGRIFVTILREEPARIEFHPPLGLHINANGEHHPQEEFTYTPLNATAGSYLVGYPGGWDTYKLYLMQHFFGTTE